MKSISNFSFERQTRRKRRRFWNECADHQARHRNSASAKENPGSASGAIAPRFPHSSLPPAPSRSLLATTPIIPTIGINVIAIGVSMYANLRSTIWQQFCYRRWVTKTFPVLFDQAEIKIRAFFPLKFSSFVLLRQVEGQRKREDAPWPEVSKVSRWKSNFNSVDGWNFLEQRYGREGRGERDREREREAFVRRLQ